MRGLDDGPDGLNDAVFDRALGLRPRHRKADKPAATPTPSIDDLERAYARAHKAEMDAVAALPEPASKQQTDRCWRLAEAANVARRALQVARGE